MLLAGVAAGTINTVVGSGTLITFPTLLALGFAPVTANVSNNIGLVFGGITGAWGYRRELAGQRGTLVRLIPASLVGAVAGALLLLRLPAKAFETIVPVLIAIALVLISVFVPSAFITGISGQFYRQFALTIAGATIISLMVSLTLSPALCTLLM